MTTPEFSKGTIWKDLPAHPIRSSQPNSMVPPIQDICKYLEKAVRMPQLDHSTLQRVLRALQRWLKSVTNHETVKLGVVPVLAKVFDALLQKDYGKSDVLNSLLDILFVIEDIGELTKGKEECGSHFISRLLAVVATKLASVNLRRAAVETLCVMITRCPANQQILLERRTDCLLLFNFLLSKCGDFQLQASIVEVSYRLSRRDPQLINSIEDGTYKRTLQSLHEVKRPNLLAEIRNLVMLVNNSMGQFRSVYSFTSEWVKINGQVITAAEERWVDFGKTHFSFHARSEPVSAPIAPAEDNCAEIFDILYADIVDIKKATAKQLEIIVNEQIHLQSPVKDQAFRDRRKHIQFSFAEEDISVMMKYVLPKILPSRYLTSGDISSGRIIGKSSQGIMIPLYSSKDDVRTSNALDVHLPVATNSVKSASCSAKVAPNTTSEEKCDQTGAKILHPEHTTTVGLGPKADENPTKNLSPCSQIIEEALSFYNVEEISSLLQCEAGKAASALPVNYFKVPADKSKFMNDGHSQSAPAIVFESQEMESKRLQLTTNGLLESDSVKLDEKMIVSAPEIQEDFQSKLEKLGKRPRGRPKKNTTVVSTYKKTEGILNVDTNTCRVYSFSEGLDSQAGKRKRGRPRKDAMELGPKINEAVLDSSINTRIANLPAPTEKVQIAKRPRTRASILGPSHQVLPDTKSDKVHLPSSPEIVLDHRPDVAEENEIQQGSKKSPVVASEKTAISPGVSSREENVTEKNPVSEPSRAVSKEEIWTSEDLGMFRHSKLNCGRRVMLPTGGDPLKQEESKEACSKKSAIANVPRVPPPQQILDDEGSKFHPVQADVEIIPLLQKGNDPVEELQREPLKDNILNSNAERIAASMTSDAKLDDPYSICPSLDRDKVKSPVTARACKPEGDSKANVAPQLLRDDGLRSPLCTPNRQERTPQENIAKKKNPPSISLPEKTMERESIKMQLFKDLAEDFDLENRTAEQERDVGVYYSTPVSSAGRKRRTVAHLSPDLSNGRASSDLPHIDAAVHVSIFGCDDPGRGFTNYPRQRRRVLPYPGKDDKDEIADIKPRAQTQILLSKGKLPKCKSQPCKVSKGPKVKFTSLEARNGDDNMDPAKQGSSDPFSSPESVPRKKSRGKADSDHSENEGEDGELSRSVILVEIMLEKIRRKVELQVKEKTNKVLDNVLQILDSELDSFDAQVQQDLEEFANICTRKFENLEVKRQAHLEKGRLMQESIAQEFKLLVQESNDLLSNVKDTEAELRAIAEKQRTGQKSLLCQLQETIQQTVENAGRKISAIKKNADELHGLRDILKGWV